eukprot:1145933-Amphidinium_carterae.1
MPGMRKSTPRILVLAVSTRNLQEHQRETKSEQPNKELGKVSRSESIQPHESTFRRSQELGAVVVYVGEHLGLDSDHY